mmetsp:Transcript_11523/g.20845  ORF Transcript_11523/g.20845 Transcript_11523/m.20845 type:complete len:168 (-) Transcript_11523:260-763(-)
MADQVRALIQEGHAKLAVGDMGGALQCVAAAMTVVGGRASVMPAIERAMARWESGTRTQSDVDDLSNLLCAISLDTMAMSSSPGDPTTASGPAPMAYHQPQMQAAPISQAESLSQLVPILAETGRQDITQCAINDGSSYLCARCGGLVARGRQQHHEEYWCQSSPFG